MRSNLTLIYGMRYEFFAPYTEKYNHLSMVDTNPAGGFTSVAQVQAGQCRRRCPPFTGPSLPPRLRAPAWPRLRLPRQTVLRGGYRNELHHEFLRQLRQYHGLAAAVCQPADQ